MISWCKYNPFGHNSFKRILVRTKCISSNSLWLSILILNLFEHHNYTGTLSQRLIMSLLSLFLKTHLDLTKSHSSNIVLVTSFNALTNSRSPQSYSNKNVYNYCHKTSNILSDIVPLSVATTIKLGIL